MKIAKIHDLELKMQMFDKIKVYDKKLSILKKDMKHLHEWSLKLKVNSLDMVEFAQLSYCFFAGQSSKDRRDLQEKFMT